MPANMMKAVAIDQYGGRDRLHLAEMPIPVRQTGEVLIRVKAAALNPADWKWREGWFSEHMPLNFPHILGYDVSGTIVDGDGFVSGARVAASLEHMKGGGGYAEYTIAKSSDTTLLPPDMDFAQAAAIPTPALTGVQMIENILEVQRNERVLVTGATGAVGRFAMFAIKQAGAKVIAAVRKEYVETAKLMGADEVIVLGDNIGTGVKFDAIADTVGGDAVAKLCQNLSNKGRIATISTTPIAPDGLPTQPIFVSVQGDGKRLSQLMTAVRNKLVELPVGRILSPDDAALGHEMLEKGGASEKIVIRF